MAARKGGGPSSSRSGRPPRRTGRDARRRSFGQNFLVDGRAVARFVDRLDVEKGELVVDFGAGTGALTIPIAQAGADVIAVERDPVWAGKLETAARRAGVSDRVEIVVGDLRTASLPRRLFRVAASPPYGLTTALLARLLDDPERGPWRADLIVQEAVARKHASSPPIALRTAAWAPWWEFAPGPRIGRSSFRPKPSVDSAVLTITRRERPVLPFDLAPSFRETLRPAWDSRVRR